MKENPEAAVLKMDPFLEEEKFEKPLKDDPEKLNNMLKYSSFNRMKEFFKVSWDQMSGFSEDVRKFNFPYEIKQAFAICQAMMKDSTPSKEKEFFSPVVRKGITGDWKNYFSEDQSKRMDQKFAERMKGTEFQNIWKNYM
ncbi:Sulfotransferase family cytosolic 1B member 1 like protein [Argiope bruennichi]|uniref:Sulfotransferase family cytosolic 1B member 1 like protein n=1 Tax=Argiope bruennichi TaxID=94029 RepID=A0A8T0FRK3_ARGBR|nr:Sulfotransferase family cytosolic 1B member 1 like protein [Argiope bruennichi]